MSAEGVDALLCRWAQSKYGLDDVVAVAFEFGDHGDYSELTPGDGPFLEVTIAHGGSGLLMRREAVYDASLIREILAFKIDGEA